MEWDLEELVPEILGNLGIPVKYWSYKGREKEYVVYNEADERAAHYEDNKPQLELLDFQVHLFTAEESKNRKPLKKKIKQKLLKNNITITDIRTLYEEDMKVIHIIFECRAE